MQKAPERETEREARSAEIVAVAERLFNQNGFERTSMDEVAAEAHLTKRTLYKYFFSKEDLYFTVVLKGLRLLMGYIDASTSQGRSGLERLQRAGEAYQRFYRENPEVFRQINYSQFVKSPGEKSASYGEIARLGAGMFENFVRFIEEGKADGSIRPDVEGLKGVIALFFLLTGFFFRLSEAGEGYARRYGIDLDDLSAHAIQMLMGAIRSAGGRSPENNV